MKAFWQLRQFFFKVLLGAAAMFGLLLPVGMLLGTVKLFPGILLLLSVLAAVNVLCGALLSEETPRLKVKARRVHRALRTASARRLPPRGTAA